MIVTCFKNIFDTTEPLFVDVVSIFKRIKDGNSQKLIEGIRQANGDEQQGLKKRLPSICFSGRFGKREAESLLEHSGLICLDVDKIKAADVVAVKKVISDDEHCLAAFVSPGGLGVKIIVKIHPDKANHKAQFLALEKYFNDFLARFTSTQENKKKKGNGKIDPKQGKYLRVHVDKSGKDVNRVCYESYDPEIYWNDDSSVWYECLEEQVVQTEVSDYDLIIAKLQLWIDKKETYFKGNRNNFLYQFSCALCRYGVGEMRAMTYLNGNYTDYPIGELQTTVKGAYKASEFGSQEFTEEQKRSKHSVVNVESKKDITSFWTINDKGKVKIDNKQFIAFIALNGFGIYRQQKGHNKWDFVYVKNMVVDIVDVLDIKMHILEYIEKHAPEPVFDELQLKNRYFENTYLNALPLINVEQIRDGMDSSYIFFEDFYYEITKTDKIKHGYIDLEGRHIWKSQISKKNVTELVDYTKHDFNMFVFNAMGKDMDRYKAACSSIGYGIHTYKKKRLAKLIYTCDQSSGELDGMAMGGSGKNLFLECLKYCRAVVDIDGKDFDKRDKFKFQTVADDTQLVSIDDYEGDIKELFTKITGHFEIEKKGMQKTVKDLTNHRSCLLVVTQPRRALVVVTKEDYS